MKTSPGTGRTATPPVPPPALRPNEATATPERRKLAAPTRSVTRIAVQCVGEATVEPADADVSPPRPR